MGIGGFGPGTSVNWDRIAIGSVVACVLCAVFGQWVFAGVAAGLFLWARSKK